MMEKKNPCDDEVGKKMSYLAKTLLEYNTIVNEAPAEEMVMTFNSLLPPHAKVFSDENLSLTTFPIYLLKSVCEFYGINNMHDATLQGLSDTVKSDKLTMCVAWCAAVYDPQVDSVMKICNRYLKLKNLPSVKDGSA